MSTAVHQLLPVFSYGDAIGAATQRTRAMLHRLGYRSETFAGLVDERLRDQAHPADELERRLRPGDSVVYRLSIGSPLARRFERLDARRVVVYHNITPPSFYRGTNPRVVYWLDRGRDDLRRIVPLADLVIGDSTFNLSEAVAAGARRSAVIPPPADVGRLHPRPSRPLAPPTVLFVGRVAPNKRHERLIAALAALRATDEPQARLVLAGSADDTSSYRERLVDYAERLGVGEAVEVSGRRMTDAEIGDLYASAAVFACASEHEGFCIPLVEAMAFELPVVAYAAGAVPETLGDAGLLLRTDDPLTWAAALSRAMRDTALRATLAGLGQRRAADLSESRIEERLAAALRDAGITP